MAVQRQISEHSMTADIRSDLFQEMFLKIEKSSSEPHISFVARARGKLKAWKGDQKMSTTRAGLWRFLVRLNNYKPQRQRV